jgi:hypothetical protein
VAVDQIEIELRDARLVGLDRGLVLLDRELLVGTVCSAIDFCSCNCV